MSNKLRSYRWRDNPNYKDGRRFQAGIAHGRTEAGRSGADGDGAESGAAR